VKITPADMLPVEGPLPDSIAAIETDLLRSASPRPMGHDHGRQVPNRNSGAEQPVPEVVVFCGGRRGPRPETFVEATGSRQQLGGDGHVVSEEHIAKSGRTVRRLSIVFA